MSAILNAAPKAILQGLRTNLGVRFQSYRNRSQLTCRIFFCSRRKGLWTPNWFPVVRPRGCSVPRRLMCAVSLPTIKPC